VKAGKFGDSFYIRTHFAYSRAPPASANGTRGCQPQQQQPTELCFQPGDIFHVTDTLFGGSPGFWQVTKVGWWNSCLNNSKLSWSTYSRSTVPLMPSRRARELEELAQPGNRNPIPA
jgi:hypothetical protein